MSMDAPFTADQMHHLPNVLSGPRFATYLQSTNRDREHALKLYRWNMAVSAAFAIPLHLLEISCRNGIVDGIEAIHGSAWPWTQGFLLTLPNPTDHHKFNPRRELQKCARRHRTAGKVVAEIKFAFWERILLNGQQQIIWKSQFDRCFPGSPAEDPSSIRREDLRREIERIRTFRNRVAHHEPIFSRRLEDDFKRILKVVHWRNPTAADWLQSIETVSDLLEKRPQSAKNQ